MKTNFVFDSNAQRFVLRIPKNLGNSLFVTTLEISLGFSKDGVDKFILETGTLSDSELFEVTRKIIDFLASEKFKYITDRKTSLLIKKSRDDLRKREAIKITAKNLLRKKSKSPTELMSAEFKRTLKDYQEEPVRLIVNVPFAANFSVPGSGKTTMLYAGYSRLKTVGDIEALFIVAPGAAYISWAEEFEKCFGKKPKIARITGPKPRRIKIYDQSDKYEIFITTYQTAASDVEEISNLLKTRRFLLVLDESHNIKRFEGGAWAAAVQKLANNATRRVILTGTPVPNSLLDLWSQFHFLDQEIVGTQNQFKNLTRRSNAEEVLRDKLAPFYRRVKKKDLDLPDPVFRLIKVKAQKLQRKIYEVLKRATLEELKYTKEDRKFLGDLRKAIMIRLMQAASNPSLLFEKSEEFQIAGIQKDKIAQFIEPSIILGIKNYSKYEIPIKLVVAEKLVRQLLAKNKNKKILIWSVWIKNLNILARNLADFNPVVIYGDIPINEEKDPIDNREIRIKRFKIDPACRVLIANPGACGESISLHDVCHDAIYLDRTFNAGQYMQSLDRIHRVGLDPKTKTNYYILQVENTIDETVDRRLDEKRARMLKILNEDFEAINLETKIDEISDIAGDSQKDFNETIKDLKR
jgi:SNF2 family DNA or RNA helicase